MDFVSNRKIRKLPDTLKEYLAISRVETLGKDSGLIWSKKRSNNTPVGSVAGRLGGTQEGRKDWQLMFEYKNYLVSRVIWFLATGEDPLSFTVDHIDRNSLNNNVSNLRLADEHTQQNNKNIRKDNKSGARGVSWHRGLQKWRADVRHEGKTMYLGTYKCKLEAALAYNNAIEKFFASLVEEKKNDLSNLVCSCEECKK